MTGDVKQIKLLIVDDEKDFLNSIAERLGMRDFDVTTATEGPLAIEAAKNDKFDVAILDIRMPGMDGMELLQILKQKHQYLEVVMLSGHASIDSAVEATKLGAYSYLEKPYDFEKLLDVLKAAYEVRLKKKFQNDATRMQEIETLALGSSPLAILQALKRLDDDEK